jgi:hypothetical protein
MAGKKGQPPDPLITPLCEICQAPFRRWLYTQVRTKGEPWAAGEPALGYSTPYQGLEEQLPAQDDNIRFVVPIVLHNVAVELSPWSGYHVLAQHHLLRMADLHRTPIPWPDHAD